MDLERMLERCRRDQWSVKDLDWSRPPRPMDRDDELAIVQLFTDMAAIERLAGALFAEQRRRAKDPTLEEIFRTFVRDEVRHAHCAELLAQHYDVHRYKSYSVSPSLRRFTPHFIAAIRHLDDDVANAYITAGELILDIALLRSIDDYVHDDMSAQAMTLINRDESRHIAIDYHMASYYASDEYRRKVTSPTARTLRERADAAQTFALMIWHAKPFLRDVFFTPMDRVDPSGVRMREAFKRMQLLSTKPGVADLWFSRFMLFMQNVYLDPKRGRLTRAAVVRITGVDPRYIERLYSPSDLERAKKMSFSELADEALAAKYAS
jgi:hypothetical protein